MVAVAENALLILRVLSDDEIAHADDLTKKEIADLTSLDAEKFDKAITYLLQSKFVDGYGSGWEGKCWITPLGVRYLEQEMASRMPLSLTAEKVLKYVLDNEPAPDYDGVNGVTLYEAENGLDLEHNVCVEAFQELEDEGLIYCPVNGATVMEWGANSTPKGRQAMHRNFKKENMAPHIGQIFNGTINATNVVNAVDSYVDEIKQVGTQNDPEAIQQIVKVVLDELASKAGNELDLTLRADFLQKLAELQREFEKPRIEPASIHRAILNVLDFGDKLGGTLQLAQSIAPYIPVLYQAAQNLQNLIGG